MRYVIILAIALAGCGGAYEEQDICIRDRVGNVDCVTVQTEKK